MYYVIIPRIRPVIKNPVGPIHQRSRLTGSLSHLTSLTSQSSHSLLSPLGTHASLNIKKHGDSFVSGNAERTRGERLGAHNESHAFGRNVLDVLDGSLFGRGGEEEGRKDLNKFKMAKLKKRL